MGIKPEDAQAWDELRNTVSHGDLLFIDPDIDRWDENFYKLMRVENLINKLLLSCMGYAGKYYDLPDGGLRAIAGTRCTGSETGNRSGADLTDPMAERGDAADPAAQGH
jgi:hypothetical protein